jgi:indoleamine 2,3-dioxygenase
MPRKHRDFLEAVERLPTIRFFVQQHGEDESLCRAFDDCLEQLRQWRGSHIAVVSKYIVRPARRHAEKTVPGTTGPRDGSEPTGFGTDHVEGEDLTGTGGSALIPFLKKTRDETVGVTGKLGIQ